MFNVGPALEEIWESGIYILSPLASKQVTNPSQMGCSVMTGVRWSTQTQEGRWETWIRARLLRTGKARAKTIKPASPRMRMNQKSRLPWVNSGMWDHSSACVMCVVHSYKSWLQSQAWARTPFLSAGAYQIYTQWRVSSVSSLLTAPKPFLAWPWTPINIIVFISVSQGVKLELGQASTGFCFSNYPNSSVTFSTEWWEFQS